MQVKIKKKFLVAGLPVLLGTAVLWIPLIRDFHIESAMIAALAGSFWGGIRACSMSPKGSDFKAAWQVLGYLYLFGLPLLMYALFTGCFSWHGLGYWLLYPVPSVFFGFAVGRLLRLWNIKYRRMSTVGILLAAALGGLLVELLLFPQVYFFNHVWGGWPGPIYDEVITVTPSLLFFRTLTLLWILILWYLPEVKKESKSIWIVALSAAALVFCYTMSAEMGIVSPRQHIRNQLGGSLETPHFRIYYDSTGYDSALIMMKAAEHEFYLEQITDTLNLAKPDSSGKIESYLYAHPWQKKRLVGAKYTSYVPVWLEQDQLHIARPQLRSLKHELVHVLAKQFGNRWINASWSIGLVEGLAVALAPDRSSTSTIDQIVVSEKPYPSTSEMESALSFSGFYGGRSTVNYTTTGSFVQYLLENYPVEYIKRSYRQGTLKDVYPDKLETMLQGWYQKLDSVTVDTVDRQVARYLFGLPSLFEQACPHVISDKALYWDRYRYYLAERDTMTAVKQLSSMLELDPEDESVKEVWAFHQLHLGSPDKVTSVAFSRDSSLFLQFFYADAFRMRGNHAMAVRYLNEIVRKLAMNPDTTLNSALAVRLDSLQWNHHLDIAYRNRLPDREIYRTLYYRTRMRSLEKSIEMRNWDAFISYGRELLQIPADQKYMDAYLATVHWLGALGRYELASDWIQKLEKIVTRPRYRERMDQEREWVSYLQRRYGPVISFR